MALTRTVALAAARGAARRRVERVRRRRASLRSTWRLGGANRSSIVESIACDTTRFLLRRPSLLLKSTRQASLDTRWVSSGASTAHTRHGTATPNPNDNLSVSHSNSLSSQSSQHAHTLATRITERRARTNERLGQQSPGKHGQKPLSLSSQHACYTHASRVRLRRSEATPPHDCHTICQQPPLWRLRLLMCGHLRRRGARVARHLRAATMRAKQRAQQQPFFVSEPRLSVAMTSPCPPARGCGVFFGNLRAARGDDSSHQTSDTWESACAPSGQSTHRWQRRARSR